MAVGDFAKVGVQSVLGFRQESTYGTFAATTTAIQSFQATKIGLQTKFDTEKLDELGVNRGYSRQIQKNKMVDGEVEGFLHPEECAHFLINVMGGRYTFNSITSAGDHSITAGNFSASDTVLSLSLYAMKGDQHAIRYPGGVINSMKISAAINEPVKVSMSFVCQDSSISASDTAPAAAISVSTILPFTFAGSVYRYSGTEGSLTSTLNEPIQSFELEINNNLITDAGARQLGSRILSRRPPSPRRDVNLKVSQRFDTTTAFDRFVQNTAASVALFLTGESISAEYNRELNIILPNIRTKNAEPLVEGPNEVLQSEVEYDIILSGNAGTTTSREIGMTLRNSRTTSY